MALQLVTIIVPEDLMSDANQLARCIGYTEADGRTFMSADYVDGSGNRYCVASGMVQAAFVSDAFEPLVEPEWGADMEAANRAQEAVRMLNPADLSELPETITALVGYFPADILPYLGIERYVEPEVIEEPTPVEPPIVEPEPEEAPETDIEE